MSRIRLGLLTAFLVLVADQVTKTWAIGFMAAHGPGLVPVAPILDLVALWNAGISYGLFPQGETGRWVLVGIKVAAALAFTVWLTRSHRLVESVGLGLLIGGALGNAVLGWALHGAPVIEMRPAYIGGIVYLGLLGSVVTFPMYFALIRDIGAARAAYTSVLVPVVAMALSTAFEGYRWSLLAAGGAALGMIGLVIAMRSRAPRPPRLTG